MPAEAGIHDTLAQGCRKLARMAACAVKTFRSRFGL